MEAFQSHKGAPVKRLSSLAIATVAAGLFAVAACGEDDSKRQPDPWDDYQTEHIGASNMQKLDMTFVIDDSGSMCDEQRDLATSLDRFITELADENVDFHIGVTTTSPDDNGELGALNAQPNPIPKQTEGCQVESRLVETQLERAIECTEDPTVFEDVLPLTNDQKNCIDDPSSCAIDGFEIADLFPPEYAYRDLPKVLKRSDYLNPDYTLDVGSLRADFQCMAMVGTSGSSFEKGLGALVASNSPERVGEHWEVDKVPTPGASNYGLVRRNAVAAAVILTDENDCTYSNDGAAYQIDEQGACGDDACYYASSTQLTAEESPLVSPDSLRESWRANLETLKERPFSSNELFVVSAHGQPVRYDGVAANTAACESGSVPTIETTCESNRGSARSGDRYQRFLKGFDEGHIWPSSADSVQGKICVDDYLRGAFDPGVVVADPPPCLTENPAPCGSATDCSAPSLPGTSPICQDFARSGEKFCASSVDVVVSASGADARQRLRESTLCVEGTMARVDGDTLCFMKQEFYEFRACAANDFGVWPELLGQAEERAGILGLDIQLRWPAGTNANF
jgi:hypothetical protein